MQPRNRESATLEAFRDAVALLPSSAAQSVRARYRSTFIDAGKAALTGGASSTGGGDETATYEGYLWDAFRAPVLVPEADALAEIERAPSDVYVMWDLHAADRVDVVTVDDPVPIREVAERQPETLPRYAKHPIASSVVLAVGLVAALLLIDSL